VKILDDPGIEAAWTGKAAPAAAPALAVTAPGTPAALLVEVQDLVKQGFYDDDLKAWKSAGLSEKVISAAMDRAPK